MIRSFSEYLLNGSEMAAIREMAYLSEGKILNYTFSGRNGSSSKIEAADIIIKHNLHKQFDNVSLIGCICAALNIYPSPTEYAKDPNLRNLLSHDFLAMSHQGWVDIRLTDASYDGANGKFLKNAGISEQEYMQILKTIGAV